MAMEITYDKKKYKKIEKDIIKGKSRYAVKQALLGVMSNIPVYLFVMFILSGEESYYKVWEKILIIFIMSVISFVPFYFLNRSAYSHITKIYEDTREYWEKHDPTFFERENLKKIDW
jgi:hypothetical protein